jgi:hypothetical protein
LKLHPPADEEMVGGEGQGCKCGTLIGRDYFALLHGSEEEETEREDGDGGRRREGEDEGVRVARSTRSPSHFSSIWKKIILLMYHPI